MLLYDIFYHDNTFDAARPLPEPKTEWARSILRGAYAVCVNGGRETFLWQRGQWRPLWQRGAACEVDDGKK
jgi:hypothetical protein